MTRRIDAPPSRRVTTHSQRLARISTPTGPSPDVWHVPCSVMPLDTGITGGARRRRGGSPRGRRFETKGGLNAGRAPPSALAAARGHPDEGLAGSVRFNAVCSRFKSGHRPGARTPNVPLEPQRPRLKGVRGTQTSPALAVLVKLRFRRSSPQKKRIRPVNEAGRSEGFIPVTP